MSKQPSKEAVKRASRPVMEMLRTHPRVEFVDDERAMGNGVLVTLRKGWTFDLASDNRTRGEDTPSAILKAVREIAQPFAGPYDE